MYELKTTTKLRRTRKSLRELQKRKQRHFKGLRSMNTKKLYYKHRHRIQTLNQDRTSGEYYMINYDDLAWEKACSNDIKSQKETMKEWQENERLWRVQQMKRFPTGDLDEQSWYDELKTKIKNQIPQWYCLNGQSPYEGTDLEKEIRINNSIAGNEL
jgi:hypothetical protein